MTTEALYLQKLATAFIAGSSERLVLPPDLDWARLGILVDRHHVSAALLDLVDPESLSRNQLSHLEEAVEAARSRTRLYLLELERILPVIGRHGIDPVVLKGAALATVQYPRAEQRLFMDLDLLVLPDQVETACTALEALGYARIDSGLDPAYYSRHHFHWIMGNGQGHIVEIHWGLTLPGSMYRFAPGDVHDRSTAADLGRISIRVPCPEDHFLHLVLQGIASGFTSLKHVMDAALLFRQIEDYPGLADRARKQRLEIGLWILLEMVAEIVGMKEVRPLQAVLLPAEDSDPGARCRRRARHLRRFGFPALCLDRRFAELPNYHQLIHWMCLEDPGTRNAEIRRFLVPDEADLMEQGYLEGQMPGTARRFLMTVSRCLSLTRLTVLGYSRTRWGTGES